MKKKISILFVCMGNICRSPTAHGVFRKLVREAGLADRVLIDSAGTHAYHVGKPPDERAQETAQRRGSDLRARAATQRDLERFDYILVMDRDNLNDLMAMCPPRLGSKVRLFMDFAPDMRAREVPDPYYGGPSGFEQVFDMVEAAAAGLLEHVRRIHF